MSFEVSAPGSLMLLGEYAVLHGKPALVCAIDKRIKVTLVPRHDQQITIASSLGQHATHLNQLTITPPFQFVLATINKFKKKMKFGCDITISSEFSDKMGFASSAAVTVATVTALSEWLKISMSQLELVRKARSIIREVQGVGSGADVAACVFGGIIAYRAAPLKIEKLSHSYPITVMYSGSKTPTVEAIKRVGEFFSHQPNLYKQICKLIATCVNQARREIDRSEWEKVGKIMNIQQGLMQSLGVSSPVLDGIVYTLREQKTILGAKISGSGFGDCVVALGEVNGNALSTIPVQITQKGVLCEKS